MAWTYLIILLDCFVGGMLQSLIGFGCAIVMMALLPYILSPLPQVAGMTSVICMCCSLALVLRYRRPVKFRVILPVFFVYILVMPVSSQLSLKMAESTLRLCLGVALLLVSIYYVFFASKALRLSSSLGAAIGAGLVSGVLSGMFTIGGPPVVLYTMSVAEDKEDYLGTIQFYFTISNMYSSIVRIRTGVITMEIMDWILMAGVGVTLGIFAGGKLQNKFDWELIRKGVYILIGFIGVTNIIQGL